VHCFGQHRSSTINCIFVLLRICRLLPPKAQNAETTSQRQRLAAILRSCGSIWLLMLQAPAAETKCLSAHRATASECFHRYCYRHFYCHDSKSFCAYDFHISFSGFTPLHHSAFDGHLDIYRLLLQSNADADAKGDGSFSVVVIFNNRNCVCHTFSSVIKPRCIGLV
jgi:hypothetical protein